MTTAPQAASMEIAESIAGKSPDAVRAIKTLLYKAWGNDAAGSLRLEAELQLKVMASPNQMEAARAVSEKRAPNFGDAVI